MFVCVCVFVRVCACLRVSVSAPAIAWHARPQVRHRDRECTRTLSLTHTRPHTHTHTHTHTPARPSVKVRAITCGVHHSLAADESGGLWSWGDGGYGRLGHNVQKDELEPKRIAFFSERNAIPTDTPAIIAAGATMSLACGVQVRGARAGACGCAREGVRLRVCACACVYVRACVRGDTRAC